MEHPPPDASVPSDSSVLDGPSNEKDAAPDTKPPEGTGGHNSAFGTPLGESIGLSGDARLTAGSNFNCMILGSGALKCWGQNDDSELGVGGGDSRGDAPGELGMALPAVRFPAGLSARAVSAGDAHVCALLSDSSVRCWGSNAYGQAGVANAGAGAVIGDVPAELGSGLVQVQLGRPATAVAAGYYANCALLDNGDVKCWGDNSSGQLGVGSVSSKGGSPSDFPLDRVPLGTNRTAVALAGGWKHFCAILDNGQVKCWGDNGHGQLGIGSTVSKGGQLADMGDALPAVPLGRFAVSLSLGLNFSCARLDDGSVTCWGDNQLGQLGTGDRVRYGASGGNAVQLLQVNLGGAKVRAITAGALHVCAILNTGAVKCWGWNGHGVLGIESTTPADTGDTPPTALPPVALGTLRTARAISAGSAHTCAWLDNGSVKCWGFDDHGQLGIGTTTDRGDLPNSMGDKLPAVYLHESLSSGVTAKHVCATLDDGSLSCWGSNGSGQLGLGDTIDRGTSASQMNTSLRVSLGTGRTAVSVSGSLWHTCAALDDGTVKCWGYNDSGQLGTNDTVAATSPPPLGLVLDPVAKAVAVSVGSAHSCALLDDGTVRCWGDGQYGALGTGTTNVGDGTGLDVGPNMAKVPLRGTAKAKAISAGQYFTCALMTDSTLQCWGRNANGQMGLGLPPPSDQLNPVIIDLGSGFTVRALGTNQHGVCVLLNTGNVKCWGYGEYGTLGQGNGDTYGSKSGETAAAAPTVPLSVGEIVSLSSSGAHNCVTYGDGRVICWGNNQDGELGIGNNTNQGIQGGQVQALPEVPLATGASAVSVIGGQAVTCALLSDQSRKCWGDNANGALGQGDTQARGDKPGELGDALLPIKLGATRAAIQVVLGYAHGCAILETGSVKCWGDNLDGELGVGDVIRRGTSAADLGDSLLPVRLGTGRTARQLAAGDRHTCALLDDGTVKCWGKNSFGQLGVGDVAPRGAAPNQMNDDLSAVPLFGGQTAAAVTAGREHSCAILSNGQVQCWGRNDLGQLGQGNTNTLGDQPGELGNNLPPVALGTGRTARAITASLDSTCALLDNGRIKCWGGNSAGELGLGDVENRGYRAGQMGDALQPVDLGTNAIGGPVRGTAVGASCALLEGGNIKCWGLNKFGQAGQGDGRAHGSDSKLMGDALLYVPFPGRTATSLWSGPYHNCAVLDTGELKCWGKNASGQLGTGTTINYGSRPDEILELPSVALGAGRTALQVAVQNDTTCALLDNGAVECWGDNSSGQVGIGSPIASVLQPSQAVSLGE